MINEIIKKKVGARRVQRGSREGPGRVQGECEEGAARQPGTWSAPRGDISKEEEKKKSYDERWGKKKKIQRIQRKNESQNMKKTS